MLPVALLYLGSDAKPGMVTITIFSMTSSSSVNHRIILLTQFVVAMPNFEQPSFGWWSMTDRLGHHLRDADFSALLRFLLRSVML